MGRVYMRMKVVLLLSIFEGIFFVGNGVNEMERDIKI